MASAEGEIPVYYISGHGSENMDGYTPTFRVPTGCTIVVKSIPGSLEWFYPQKLYSFCSLPIEILSHPSHYSAELIREFGSVAIFREGDQCPNFSYSLVACYDNFPNNEDRTCHKNGAGVLDIRKVQESLFCKGIATKPEAMSNTDYSTIKMVDEKFANNEPLIQTMIDMYTNSVYPTKQEVKDFLIGTHSLSVELEKKDLIKHKLSRAKLKFALIKTILEDAFYISQRDLCLTFKGVYYNFVCRWTEDHNSMFEWNRDYVKDQPRYNISKLNSIVRTPGHKRNLQLRHLTESIRQRKPGVMEWYEKYGVGGTRKKKRTRKQKKSKHY